MKRPWVRSSSGGRWTDEDSGETDSLGSRDVIHPYRCPAACRRVALVVFLVLNLLQTNLRPRFLSVSDSSGSVTPTHRDVKRGSASTSSWTWLCFVTPPLLQVLTWKLSQHAFLQPDTRPQPPGEPFKSRRSLSLMSECFLTRPNCSRLSAWSGFPASSAARWDSSNQETGLFVFSIWLAHI